MNTSNITNYKLKDFAELLGVSVKTLQRWDREGILKANRTPTDRRYYTYDQYLQFKGINTENDNRQIVIYARVSTRNQKDDFVKNIDEPGCYLNRTGVGILIKKLEKKFQTDVKYLDYVEYPVNFRHAMMLQVNQLVKAIENEDASIYHPIQIR